ncbi:MAG TPA: glycosyl transferase family 90 [Chlamydiales bacterium]|nr:glycosyl transferase family 90 [Chlamydiales bacterium]
MWKWLVRSLFTLLCLTIVILSYEIEVARKSKRFSVNIDLNEELFRQKVAAPAPEWMLRQIRKDLEPFAKQRITSQMIDENFHGKRSEEHGLNRFTVKNGWLTVSLSSNRLNNSGFRKMRAAIVKLQQLVPLPDVDFLISSIDGFDTNSGNFSCPVFVFSKRENLYPFVLMPDKKALRGYRDLKNEILQANQNYPWERKKAELFWRGGANGTFLSLENWDQSPRIKLVLLSLAMPQEINARLTNLLYLKHASPKLKDTLLSKGLMGKWADKKDHLQYKYLIDIDGNACTFERLFWLLTSNSVVLKQVTPSRQWYYGDLVPYRHYIPVKEDLSDLVQQLKWARDHEEEAKKIAENATAFANTHLTPEDVYLYLYHLIVEYAKLQTGLWLQKGDRI